MESYVEFLARKAVTDIPTGIQDIPELGIHLFDFQSDIVRWALRRGRAAIFADCGLGKTAMQLEWAKIVSHHESKPVLIIAPLAVSDQTIAEGVKFGVKVTRCREQSHVVDGVNITNYEMAHHFDPMQFGGVVIDESSIIKNKDGKYRKYLISEYGKCPFKLACTATPAPNDFMEIGNHSEFLGSMTVQEMLSMFFIHDGGETQKWRLKGHASSDFWRWMCSWAVMLRNPSDLGYDGSRFILPDIHYIGHCVRVENKQSGDHLFPMEALTMQDRIGARRDSVSERVEQCAKIVNESNEPWIVWCGLNTESAALAKSISGSVEIVGSDKPESKEHNIARFLSGDARVLVTKPSICGFGMNFQHCRNMAFVGLSDSWEQYYQAVRRCWRFGQDKDVNVHVFHAETEGRVVANIKRKEIDAQSMYQNMVEHMADISKCEIKGTSRMTSKYERDIKSGSGWDLHLGDCVEVLKDIKSESVHYSIFSPPFASLYTYSASDRDMGNCSDAEEFMGHFAFAVAELFRVLKSGRLVSFHCMNLPTSKVRDGVIGLRDFRGELIRLFESVGFIYHSEVCIWKDPVTAMQRTKALGLLHKQIKKDSAMSRQGIADYLVTMRKPGENDEPVTHTNDSFPVTLWQRFASPVWMDINPSDTLQYRSAREHDDERHICPLQLDVIRRGIRLWSNPGDLVLSPFAGIGSEGYVSIVEGRRFVGIELKKSYWNQACMNLESAQAEESDGLFAEIVNT